MRWLRLACVSAVGVCLVTSCSKENNVNVGEGAAGTSGIPELPDCSQDAGTPPSSDMVRVGRLDGACFWIDRLEVTRQQYEAFVAAEAPSQLTPCDWNTAFEPDATCEGHEAVVTTSDHPQVCVDWCDALAYCEHAGKTLCRGEYPDPDDAASSSWFSVCSDGTKRKWPYGSEYQGDVCNGSDYPDNGCDGTGCTTVAVGSASSCKSASGVMDLSGNAAEWVAECLKSAGENDECSIRGGSFLNDGDGMQCAKRTTPKRSTTRRDIGFRCCAYDQ